MVEPGSAESVSAQLWKAVSPVPGQMVSRGQVTHASWPGSGWYVPGWHSCLSAAPAGQAWPAVQ